MASNCNLQIFQQDICACSKVFAGFANPLQNSGSNGDIYLNISTMTLLCKNNCRWWIVGNLSNGNNPIANVDFAKVNVGARQYINVLTNDVNTCNINSLTVTVPLDPTTEGTLAQTTEPSNGNILFTPAPRFLGSAIFGYQIKDTQCAQRTSSSIEKIIIDKSYSQIPAVLYVNRTNQIQLLNVSTVTSTPIITLNQTASELATNRGDALLYYADASASRNIYFYDFILKQSYLLMDYDAVFGLNLPAEALGFDNKRYFLYLGYESGNKIAQIAVNPYDRYQTPGIQTYTAALIQYGSTDYVLDITVEESTGYLFLCIQVAGVLNLFKVNPYDGSTIASIVATGYQTGSLSFANNGLLYGIFKLVASDDLVLINTYSLNFTVINSSVLVPQTSDMSELLFNM